MNSWHWLRLGLVFLFDLLAKVSGVKLDYVSWLNTDFELVYGWVDLRQDIEEYLLERY